jgi:inositol-phosphate phosphatase / L-galactose 1-phosphate phosphatase / histidinol-phosphatase
MNQDDKFVSIANLAADTARRILKSYYRNISQNVIVKDDKSLVTEADRDIERSFRELVKKEFTGHGILGEEEENINLNADYIWVIDPIDGTDSFILGRPLFGTLIGLYYKGKPLLGLIDQAITKERWFAYKNNETTLNNIEVKTSTIKKLNESKILFSSPELFNNNAAVKEIHTKSKLAAWEAECYGYGLLAMGSVDAVIKAKLDPYDYLPVVKVIENAGGIIRKRNGEVLTLDYTGDVIAASSKDLFNEILKIYK